MAIAVNQEQLQPRRPALRLVKTKTIIRDDWLEVRKHGIGSSDAAAAVAFHPRPDVPDGVLRRVMTRPLSRPAVAAEGRIGQPDDMVAAAVHEQAVAAVPVEQA